MRGRMGTGASRRGSTRSTRLLAVLLVAGTLSASVAACSGPGSPGPSPAPHRIGGAGAGEILGVGVPSTSPTLRGPKDWPRPWHTPGGSCSAPPVIAHRGEGGIDVPLPENTAAAELAAAAQGASMLNADLRWTQDDVPVAIHDPLLNRTTTGTGPVLSVTAAHFTALDLRSNDGKRVLPGHKHPQTLAQLLAAVKPTGLPIVLQMEADPFSAGGAGQASIDALAAVIAASGYADKVVVGGWAADDVSAFSAAAPDVMTAFIQESSKPAPSSIIATGARILYIDFRQLTARQIVSLHAAGIAVWAWTPPFSTQWKHLRAIGVDAIATNWVPFYTRWSKPCRAVPLT